MKGLNTCLLFIIALFSCTLRTRLQIEADLQPVAFQQRYNRVQKFAFPQQQASAQVRSVK